MSAFDFLTHACRIWLGTEPGPVQVGPEVDFDELRSLGFVHNLDPLLHHLTSQGGIDADSVPPTLLERWEETYFKNRVFNDEALAAVGRLSAACARDGVEMVVFKGPATLARAYRDPALRVMVDLDVLCREEELADLGRIAAEQGFVGGLATTVHHLTFTQPALPLGLEVHFDLYDFLPARGELIDELLGGVVPLALGGHGFPALSPEGALAMDVAHLVNHDFRVGLKHLLDLAAQARFSDPPLDPARIAGRVRRFDLEPELDLAAFLVERLFAVRLPTPGARDDRSQTEETRRIEAGLRSTAPTWLAMTGMATRPGLREKLGYLRRLLFPPRRRLAALEGKTATGTLSGPRHIASLGHRVVRRWRSFGRAPGRGPETSVKRRVYERRRKASLSR